MIMSTFVEGLDLAGKTVLPFTTHAMSRSGTRPRDYARLLPAATIGDGLAVQGEEPGTPEPTWSSGCDAADSCSD
jgi:hypothetical protein